MNDLDQADRFGFWRALLFTALMLELITLAAWIGTAMHEAFGHCLTAALIGGRSKAFTINLFGGGMSIENVPADVAPARLFLVDAGGIAVNIVTGLVVAYWLFRLLRRGTSPRSALLPIFLGVFALLCVLSQLGYACVGLYYGFGDLSGWDDRVPVVGHLLWLFPLLIVPFASFALMRLYLRAQDLWFPLPTPSRRVLFTCVTFGLACILFAPLHLWGSIEHTKEFPKQAQETAVTRAKTAVVEARVREIQQAQPTIPRPQAIQQAQRIPVHIEPKEVKPGPWVLIGFFALMIGGALASLWVGAPHNTHPSPPLALRHAMVPTVLVAAGLIALTLVDRRIPLPIAFK